MTAGNGIQKEKNEKEVQPTSVSLDDAMLLTGFGFYNIGNMLLSGLVLLGMIMETLGMSYVIPAAQCDLELTLQQKGWLAAIPFIAIIITSHFWGWMADTKGRRPIILTSMTISAVLSTLSSFSPNLLAFAILRFMACIFISGPSGVVYTYVGEFNSVRHRDRMVAFAAAFVGIGTVLLPCISWLILPQEFALPISFLGIDYRPWRLLVVACAIPYATAAFIMLFASESPKFLYADGQYDKCLKVVKNIYAVNKRTSEDNFPITSLLVEGQTSISSKEKGIVAVLKSMKDQTIPLFKSPLVPWTCLACFVQMGIMATSNGFYVWFPSILNSLANSDASNQGKTICDVLGADKSESSFNNTMLECDDSVNTETFERAILVGLVFCSTYVVVGILVDYVKKKTIIFVILAAAGISGLTSHLVANQIAAVALFSVFQMAGACIGLLTAVVVELYPTKLRAMAVCLSLMLGRVGSVLGSNIIGILLETNCGVSFYLFGGLLIVCSLLCLTLPGSGKIKTPAAEVSDTEVSNAV